MKAIAVEKLKKILGDKDVLCDEGAPSAYCHDEMTAFQRKRPAGHFIVIRPQNTQQVSQALKLAAREGIPVTARGAGTGLCGGCVPLFGGIVLSLERMDNILELDKENLMITVQAGTALSKVYEALEGSGLFFPPHPGDEGAHIGGLAATNAGGARAVKYGTIRNYIRGIEAVLAGGEIIRLGGKFVKSSAGFNLLALFIGSEGTLGVITEATLSLLPKPAASATLIAPFEKLGEAIKAVPVIISGGILPAAIEFMERDIIELAEKKFNKKWPAPKAASYLMFILDAGSDDELENTAHLIADVCQRHGALDVFVADSAARQKEVLDFRSSFHEVLKPDMIEDLDLTVPRSKIAELVEYIHGLEKRYKARLLTYGHAGDGNVHVHVMKTRGTWDVGRGTRGEGRGTWDEGRGAWDEGRGAWDVGRGTRGVKKELYRKTKELGGTLTGEHGIGFIKADDLPEFTGDAQIKLMKGIKKAFDPKGILNPGKVLK